MVPPAPRTHRSQRSRLVVACLVAAAAGVACRAPPDAGRFPPPPPTPAQDLGPTSPPVVWVGGRLTRVTADRLVVREPSGAVLTLRRLGVGATSFYRVRRGRWDEQPADASAGSGRQACVETLVDGDVLLALRVFLGAGCGPA